MSEPILVGDVCMQDAEELRDIAGYFDSRGKKTNGDFLRAVASRHEVLAGAYATASSIRSESLNFFTIEAATYKAKYEAIRDRAERAEAELTAERERADRNQEDAERLDWMDKSAFTAYRDRDPEYGELYDFATVVNEDRKGDGVGEVFKTIREAIDAARRK